MLRCVRVVGDFLNGRPARQFCRSKAEVLLHASKEFIPMLTGVLQRKMRPHRREGVLDRAIDDPIQLLIG
jgi:hypothetical protein